MKYNDGQLDTVQGTLDEAYAAAGKKPKPEETAPPFEEEGD